MRTILKDKYNGYKYTDHPQLYTCAYCKKQYKYYTSEIKYTTNFNHKRKRYCSYQCKQDAIKERNQLLEQKEQQAIGSLKDYMQYLIDQGHSYMSMSIILNMNITKVAALVHDYNLTRPKKSKKR